MHVYVDVYKNCEYAAFDACNVRGKNEMRGKGTTAVISICDGKVCRVYGDGAEGEIR